MSSADHSQPLSSTSISLAFWLTLILASAMYAALALANLFQDKLALQARVVENANQAELLHSEIDHLSRLITAYRSDPDFIQRVVENDFGQNMIVPDTQTQRVIFDLEPTLMFDAREFRQARTQASVAPWYASWIDRLATPGEFRSRWQWTMLALFGLSFICLNEDFFQGRLGRTLAWTIHLFGQRYRTSQRSSSQDS